MKYRVLFDCGITALDCIILTLSIIIDNKSLATENALPFIPGDITDEKNLTDDSHKWINNTGFNEGHIQPYTDTEGEMRKFWTFIAIKL